MFSVSCTENSFTLPSVITFCIFCGVLMQISSSNSKSILLRSLADTTQILQGQLQLIELYVNIIDAYSNYLRYEQKAPQIIAIWSNNFYSTIFIIK